MTESGATGSEPVGQEREDREPEDREQEPVAAEDTGSGQQSELDLGVVPTGDPRVDAALAELDALTDRSVDEHPEVFEAVHEGLHEALSDVSEPSG